MMFLSHFVRLFLFLVICAILGLIIFFIPYLFALKVDDKEKLSAYECGFNPFEDSRSEFDVKFYLVGILFIIFDLELSFLFPFALCLDEVTTIGVVSMYFFLIVLTLGFYYE
jgi:NADH-quinone oxidoreductase subunit A